MLGQAKSVNIWLSHPTRNHKTYVGETYGFRNIGSAKQVTESEVSYRNLDGRRVNCAEGGR